jgi:hypothetical protein
MRSISQVLFLAMSLNFTRLMATGGDPAYYNWTEKSTDSTAASSASVRQMSGVPHRLYSVECKGNESIKK